MIPIFHILFLPSLWHYNAWTRERGAQFQWSVAAAPQKLRQPPHGKTSSAMLIQRADTREAHGRGRAVEDPAEGARQRMKIFNAVLIVTLPTLALACGAPPPGQTASPAASPAAAPSGPAADTGEPLATSGGAAKDNPVKQYNIRAKIVTLAAERQMATLDHEQIPGVMAAMKRDYHIANTAMLQGLAAGDEVTARLEDRAGTYVIVSLQKR
jgi:Cu/Ag efflux protein CusF